MITVAVCIALLVATCEAVWLYFGGYWRQLKDIDGD